MPSTLAGGQQIDAAYFHDTIPVSDRTVTPESDIQAFLAKVPTFYCQAHACTMRTEQCTINRNSGNYLCGKCTQERPGQASVQFAKKSKLPAEPKKRGRRRTKPIPPGCQWIGRQLIGPCPSCDRPGQVIIGDACGRCNKRIAKGQDVHAPSCRTGRPKKALAQSPEPKAQSLTLKFTGDDADIIRRFADKSRADGHDPAYDLACIALHVLDGDIQWREE